MPEFVQTIDIDGPAAAAWAVVDDPASMPALSPSTVRVWDEPARITATGQTFSHEVRFGGRTFTTQWLVTDFDDGRTLTIEGQGAGARWNLAQTVTPAGGERCTYALRVWYRLPGGPLGWLVSRAGAERRARGEATDVAANLKALVESRNTPVNGPS